MIRNHSLAYLKFQTFLMICDIVLTVNGENPLWFSMQNNCMVNAPLLINKHGVLLTKQCMNIFEIWLIFSLETKVWKHTKTKKLAVLTAEVHSGMQPGPDGSEMI